MTDPKNDKRFMINQDKDPKEARKKIHVDLPEIGFPPKKKPSPQKEAPEENKSPAINTPEPEESNKKEVKKEEKLESTTSESADMRDERPAKKTFPIFIIVLISLLAVSFVSNLLFAFNIMDLKTRSESDAKVTNDMVIEKETIRKSKDSLEKEVSAMKKKFNSMSGTFADLKKERDSMKALLAESKESIDNAGNKLKESDKEIDTLKSTNSKLQSSLKKERGMVANLSIVVKEQEKLITEQSRKPDKDILSDEDISDKLYEMAILYAKAEMYDKSIATFKKYAKLYGENPEAYFNIAYIYENAKKDIKKAILFYKKYIELDPEVVDLHEIKMKIGSLERVGKKKSKKYWIDLDKLKY